MSKQIVNVTTVATPLLYNPNWSSNQHSLSFFWLGGGGRKTGWLESPVHDMINCKKHDWYTFHGIVWTQLHKHAARIEDRTAWLVTECIGTEAHVHERWAPRLLAAQQPPAGGEKSIDYYSLPHLRKSINIYNTRRGSIGAITRIRSDRSNTLIDWFTMERGRGAGTCTQTDLAGVTEKMSGGHGDRRPMGAREWV